MKDLTNKNVIHVKSNDIEYLQFRKLLEYNDIIKHAYTLGLDVGFKTTTANKTSAPPDRIKLAEKSYEKI